MTNPLGHHNPNFVLYDDGFVVFKRGDDERSLYSTTLPPDGLERFRQDLALDEGFMQLDDDYSFARHHHEPMYAIYVNHEGQVRKVRVTGRMVRDEEARRDAPADFLRTLDVILAFDRENASPWEPHRLLVRGMWYRPDDIAPATWPADWPSIEDSINDDDGFTTFGTYLDGRERDRLVQFLAQLKPAQTVSIDNETWHIRPVRHALQGEEVWRTY